MIHSRPFSYGVVGGVRYAFDRRGEGLALHSHQPEAEHNVIVLRGAISVNGGPRIGAPGIIGDLPASHEIAALEGGTVILNLFRLGKPAGWDEERAASEESKPLHYSIENR